MNFGKQVFMSVWWMSGPELSFRRCFYGKPFRPVREKIQPITVLVSNQIEEENELR